MIHFDTDYMAGAHPEVMKRLVKPIWSRLPDTEVMRIRNGRKKRYVRLVHKTKPRCIFW